MTLSFKLSLLAGGWAASLAFLAPFPALAQLSTGYVDGASSCNARTGDKTCPFRMIGEGVKRLFPGGMLFVRGGSYAEPVLLNKAMQIQAYDGVATIFSPPRGLALFDLVADRVDDNLLLLNPQWGTARNDQDTESLPDPHECPQKERTCPPGCPLHESKVYFDTGNLTGFQKCSNQYTYQNNSFACGPHLNWFGATYTGTIFWESKSCGAPLDDYDYNMNLAPDNKAGLATTRDRLHLEFDNRETINHFTSGTFRTWWSKFHRAVDDDGRCSKTGPLATGMIGENGSRAIVTALVGFDTEHDTFVELHPVWALAMNVEPFLRDDDTWVFFARNWGNEGYCGGYQEFIDFPSDRYTFHLPWRATATSVTVTGYSFEKYHTQNPSPSEENGLVRIAPGQGVFITFLLDRPRDDGSLWNGELHLRWQ